MGEGGLFLRVGVFLAAGLALLVAAVFLLTGDRWREGRHYETYFRESVQGLDIGAPVKFRGVTIGQITDIGLVSAEYGATAEEQIMEPDWRSIVVRFKVDPRRIGRIPGTTLAIEHGLRAKLANQGLTGVMYLEIDFLPPERNPFAAVPWVPRDDYIPSAPSTIAQLADAAQRLLDHAQRIDFDGISRRLDTVLDRAGATLAADGDAAQLLKAARQTVVAIGDAVREADLPALSAQLRRTGGAVERLADGPRTQELLVRARQAIERLPALADSLRQVSARADSGIADAQAELAPLLADARAAVRNLREATEALRRNPGALLFEKTPPREAP